MAISRYASFYWPLALTSLLALLELQFQNGVLARYPDAEVQLATFALASGSFQLLNAFLVFVPQMVTVLGRNAADRGICLRFVLMVGLILAVPLLVMSWFPPGTRLLALLLGIPAAVLPQVIRYLQWLTPLVVVNALCQYYVGVLVLAERTRLVTLLNAAHLTILVGVLLAGRALGWSAIGTLACATISANTLRLMLSAWAAAWRREPEPPGPTDGPHLTHRAVFIFFWPVAMTSAMFAMTRPVLYAFVNRTDLALTTIAALRLAFDVGLCFQNPVNQFRHLYTTFGEADPVGVRRFMVRITAGLTLAMLVLAFTPLGRLFFIRVLGVHGPMLGQAVDALRVLCLAPAIIAVRNVYHGELMVGRRTGGMAVGSALRVLAIGGLAWLALRMGILDHTVCAMLLVAGFLAEAISSRCAVRRLAPRAAPSARRRAEGLPEDA